MTKLPSDSTCGNRQQRGMTLIEILVAIVVLSIGLLGLAGLQLKGMQVNQGSVYRWQAAMLAEDIADRMRADRAGALGGNYTLAATPAAGASAPSSGAAGTQAAINDWLARVAALPGGNVAIAAPVAGTTAGSTVIGITVGWADTRAQAGVQLTGTAATTGSQTGTNQVVLTTEF
jgi:type IV pilus assembly protein PilV